MSGQPGSPRTRRRRASASPGVGRGLVIFFLLGAFLGTLGSHGARQTSAAGLSLGSAPIPGELTTIADARSRAAYPILTIPETSMIHPCRGLAFTVQLQEVWASSTAVSRSDRQVGLTYNSGIWVSYTPESWYRDSIASATELPAVSRAFSSDDFPDGLTTGVVRGHTAWLAEVGPGVCASESQSGGPLPYSEALMAHLEWMEDGVVIQLAGPYPVAQLQALASSMIAV